jgi:hypothetical protein
VSLIQEFWSLFQVFLVANLADICDWGVKLLYQNTADLRNIILVLNYVRKEGFLKRSSVLKYAIIAMIVVVSATVQA